MPDVVCACCELDHPERHCGPIVVTGLNRGWRCRMCNEHQGEQLKMALDHENELRVRLGEVADERNSALDDADDYREKMNRAYRSRERVLRQFELLSYHHRVSSHGCSCGKGKCESQRLIGVEWITELIEQMNERNSGPA